MPDKSKQFLEDQCAALFWALESAAKDWCDQDVYEYLENTPIPTILAELVRYLNASGYVVVKDVGKL